MQEEDWFIRQINQLGRVLGKILADLITGLVRGLICSNSLSINHKKRERKWVILLFTAIFSLIIYE
jgi:hypothetical protein